MHNCVRMIRLQGVGQGYSVPPSSLVLQRGFCFSCWQSLCGRGDVCSIIYVYLFMLIHGAGIVRLYFYESGRSKQVQSPLQAARVGLCYLDGLERRRANCQDSGAQEQVAQWDRRRLISGQDNELGNGKRRWSWWLHQLHSLVLTVSDVTKGACAFSGPMTGLRVQLSLICDRKLLIFIFCRWL